MKCSLCGKMSDDWRLRDEIKFLIYRYFRFRRWKSLNFGIEISLWFVAIYFIIWSVEIGVRKYNE